jgi:hypothetical protein
MQPSCRRADDGMFVDFALRLSRAEQSRHSCPTSCADIRLRFAIERDLRRHGMRLALT